MRWELSSRLDTDETRGNEENYITGSEMAIHLDMREIK
jgi:hypothetical protein